MAKRKKQQFSLFSIISIAIVILAAFAITYYTNKSSNKNTNTTTFTSVSKIPDDVINSLTAPKESEATDNNKYKVLNNNNPYFAKEDLSTTSYENYSPLDKLGRVGQANGIIGVDLMPTDKREEIVVFFLYFEFVALIVKYFKNNYHFPLRYFIYIGITAIVRLIIVQHDNPYSVLIWSGAILLLVISLAIAEKFIKKN